MPELIEQMYCSQQIVIPPKFPYILKRYCKAAIKTQPYDLLRWSFEYFRALAERRPPPVKLRLEYPVYSTEGGLTRGCLKVLANQLLGMKDVPLPALKAAWRGFCLDPNELTRIICLCEAYLRRDSIPLLRFIAVAGGLLTKNLTHTMILLCETLTKEPDGGSAAIPVEDFLEMYTFLARMRAERDVRYINGYREGDIPTPETESEPEEEESEKSLEIQKLRDLSDSKVEQKPEKSGEAEANGKEEDKENSKKKEDGIAIVVLDEDGNPVPYEFYGEPDNALEYGEEGGIEQEPEEEEVKEEENSKFDEKEIVNTIIHHLQREQARRRKDLENTFYDIARLVNRYKSASYDLGVVAGRQMSITSGEFIVQNIEREIMEYIDEQIAILPDPDLKKKKAKPEEVEMVRELLEEIVDDSYHLLAGDVEGIEEEEEGPIPDIVKVYAVPGIGPAVPEDMITDLSDYASEVSRVQANLFMPRNIRHFLCPPLEKYEEYKYNEYQKEEVPTGGTITD